MQRTPWLAASLAALALSLTGASLAQSSSTPGGAEATPPGTARPGPGPGPGYGPGPGRGPNGGGPGWGRNGPRMGRDYTPGWSMMTPQERDAFHQRMWESKTRAECRQVFDEHRKSMEQRAGERGFTMRGPRHDPCAALRG